jgi:cytochrome oxidase Cu insertion factor (SCO1/SenC/PrrC family)
MSAANPKSRARVIIGLLTLLCVAPVVASYLVYYYWRPFGEMNYGQLLKPTPVPDDPLTLVDGKPFRISQLRGKWVFIMADSGKCDEACFRKLYVMRQVRLTQGKDQDRIERVWLIADDAAPAPKAVAAYAGTWMVRAAGSRMLAAFPAADSVRNHIYIIDPQGNLMMRYPPRADPNRIKKDIARLLKVSQVG